MQIYLQKITGDEGFLDSVRDVIRSLEWTETKNRNDANIIIHNHATPRGQGLSWKNSYIKGWYYFESGGYSAWSNFQYNKRTPIRYINKYREVSNGYINRKQSKLDQPKGGEFDFLDSSWAFLGTQRSGDSVAFFCKYDWHIILYKIYDIIKNSKIKLAIKRHPLCSDIRVTKQLKRLDSLSNIRIINANIHNILPRVGSVITSNSGVGFEGCLYSKPVYLLSRADYEKATIRIKISDIANLPKWSTNHKINQAYVIGAMFTHSFVHRRDRDRIKSILVDFAIKKFGPKIIKV